MQNQNKNKLWSTILISPERINQIKILKAQHNFKTYDTLIKFLIEFYESKK